MMRAFSGKEYEAIFDNTGTAMAIIGNDKTLELVNHEFELLSGFSSKSIEGKMKWTVFFTPECLEYMEQYHDARRKNPRNAPRNYEAIFKDRHGNERPVLMTVAIIPGTKKSVASLMDLTSLKQLTQSLSTSRQYLKNIINSADMIIVSADESGNINNWNKRATSKTMIKEHAIIGKSISKDEFPAGVNSLISLLKTALSSKKSETVEHPIHDDQGNESQVISSTYLVKADDGSLKGVVLLGKEVEMPLTANERIASGEAYLLFDKPIEEIISSLGDTGILLVSRENVTSEMKRRIKFISLTVNELKNTKSRSFGKISDKIKAAVKAKNPKISVVVLDRIEYLLNATSLKETLYFIYSLRDLAREKGFTLVLRVARNCLESKELAFISEEFKALPEEIHADQHLDKKKADLLKIIAQNNAAHRTVPFNRISKELKLSRFTTKKWVKELQLAGLVFMKKEGREKILFLTEKGKSFV